MQLGSRIGRITQSADRARYMQDGWLRHRLLEWQEPVDEVTLACLARTNYTGEFRPLLTSIR